MRIHGITVVRKIFVNTFDRVVLARKARREFGAKIFKLLLRNTVLPRFGERIHSLSRKLRAPARKLVDKPFKVRGKKNIHGGRHGFIEGALRIIIARADKIGQNVVLVGRTQKPSNGKPHFFCVIRRKNITEVPRRHGKVRLFARLNLLGSYKVAIGGKVIGDLRKQPSDIDRIRRG